MKKILLISILFLCVTFQNYGQTPLIRNASPTYHSTYVSNSGNSTLINGLIASWELDETSGNVTDEINSYTGTAVGTPTYDASGKIGRCITFTGANYFDCGIITALRPTTSFTISAWVKTSASSYDCPVSNTVYSTNWWGWHMTTELSVVKITVGDGTNNTIFQGTSVINNGAWHHWVLTYDGTTVTLYIDGSVDGTPTGFTSPIVYYTTSHFEIGARNGANQYMVGSVDLVHLWNRGLSSTEVTELYTKENTGTTYPW